MKFVNYVYLQRISQLLFTILAGTNFGGSSNLPNRLQIGGINFGGCGEKIKFGRDLIWRILSQRHFWGNLF